MTIAPPKILLVAVVLAGMGCASAQQGSPGTLDFDRGLVEQYLGKGVVGEAVDAPTITRTSDYFPLVKGKWTYRIEEGRHAAEVEEMSDVARDGGVRWSRRIGNRAVSYLQSDAGGDVVRTAQVDNEQGIMSTFDPPELVIARGLRQGDEKRRTVAVSVADLTQPNTIKYTGQLDVTYRYVGAFRVTVPAGTYDAVLVTAHYRGKVGPATVDDLLYGFFAKGVGKIASIEQKSVSAMLFYNKDTKVGKVLVK